MNTRLECLREALYGVKRGKPVYVCNLKENELIEAEQMVKDEELYAYPVPASTGWIHFYAYKYPHLLEVIKSAPNQPQTAYDHWVLGKMFGYDEQSIHEFVTKASTQS